MELSWYVPQVTIEWEDTSAMLKLSSVHGCPELSQITLDSLAQHKHRSKAQKGVLSGTRPALVWMTMILNYKLPLPRSLLGQSPFKLSLFACALSYNLI